MCRVAHYGRLPPLSRLNSYRPAGRSPKDPAIWARQAERKTPYCHPVWVRSTLAARGAAMWFTGWQPIGRAVLFALIAYFALITLVRLLGKRTISKMNPGDFVVTVAVGSVAANLIVSNDISLGQGLA